MKWGRNKVRESGDRGEDSKLVEKWGIKGGTEGELEERKGEP